MKDERFLEDLINGRTAVPMVSNILMDVEMRLREEKRGGAWQIVERTIVNVRAVRPPASQQRLALPPPQ
jgi:hypothetical protein